MIRVLFGVDVLLYLVFSCAEPWDRDERVSGH